MVALLRVNEIQVPPISVDLYWFLKSNQEQLLHQSFLSERKRWSVVFFVGEDILRSQYF